MKIGILGTGFGAFHAELYMQNPLVDAIKIWGRDKAKREAVARRLGIEAAESMDEIIGDPSMDLIDVCLPNELHKAAILAVLERGKQAYCETPVCTNPEDVKAIQEALSRHGGRVFANQFIKFFPEYRHVHDLAASGEYGKLLSLHAWRNTPAIWGELGFNTIAANLMMHDLDFVTWVAGSPEGIQVSGVMKSVRECCVDAWYKQNGVSAHVSASSMMPASYPFTAGFTAVFERAAVEFVGQFPEGEPMKHAALYTGEGRSELHLPQANPYAAAIGHVLDCCRNNKPSDIDFDAAVAPVGAAVAIREALLGCESHS